MQKKKKIKVAVLGATGLIGQVFVRLLSEHPFFEPAVLTASDNSRGKPYREAVNWRLPFDIPESCLDMMVEEYDPELLRKSGVRFVFSALPASEAGPEEKKLRENGFYVFSNTSANRYEPDVPVLIPDVNPGSLTLIHDQGYPGKGFIVCNPNCSTSGLAVALFPLKQFGITEVIVSTYQAVSGAGYPGVPSIDMTGNILPYIEGEEEKIAREAGILLGEDIPVFATCMRVPTLFGHIGSVWVKLGRSVSGKDIAGAWERYLPPPGIPSLPRKTVICLADRRLPGNHLAFHGSPPGMQVFTGGLRVQDHMAGFNFLVNNLVRGGAGGSVSNAELFLRQYGGNHEKDRG